MKLVIVESPTKAKTISKFLGKTYKVMSSFGHVRDLPKSKMGIDVKHGFEPTYVVPTKAEKNVAALKEAAKKADSILFATDADREGEAISWHLAELLSVESKKIQRIVFHEITKEAILEALKHPRPIDMNLVDAQQARRVLDRLVGYELSPFLWTKVVRGLSAGRVQSVAVRLIVEREREVLAFKADEYWTIEGQFKTKKDGDVAAKLHSKDSKTLDKLAIKSQTEADAVLKELGKAAYSIEALDKKKTRRSPAAPYTTSTLQQDANNKLGYSAKQAMMLAQQLYEGIALGDEGQVGLITYMRTDSVNLSEKFLADSADWLKKHHPAAYEGPRSYKTKSKGAQEAHEAVRPTEALRTPDQVKPFLDDRQYKLYDLIWRRAVASQMKDSEIETTAATIATGTAYRFRASGSVVIDPGFMAVYQTETKDSLLPQMRESDALTAETIEPKQHFTEPPARYSEATLVKAMEEHGIGRPSTYAPTISTIVDRGYATKEERRLKPTEIAFLVSDLLVEHFKQIVDFDFTAKLEDTLDAVASGETKWQPLIKDFYVPFHTNLKAKEKELDKKNLTEKLTDEDCVKCGKKMMTKMGRYGKFMSCSGYPECKNSHPLPPEQGGEVIPTTDETCDVCKAPMAVKRGRFGWFLSCSTYPTCKNLKSIQKKTGVKCPQCKEGDIVEKRSRKGARAFYACNRYPKCEYAMWAKPNGEACPTCNSLLAFGKAGTIVCSNKECGFKKDAPAE
jgi:DNA topoisomerase-1